MKDLGGWHGVEMGLKELGVAGFRGWGQLGVSETDGVGLVVGDWI